LNKEQVSELCSVADHSCWFKICWRCSPARYDHDSCHVSRLVCVVCISKSDCLYQQYASNSHIFSTIRKIFKALNHLIFICDLFVTRVSTSDCRRTASNGGMTDKYE